MFLKKAFLKISQYSQENTCVGVSLTCNFLKRKLQHSVLLSILINFSLQLFCTELLQWLLKTPSKFYFEDLYVPESMLGWNFSERFFFNIFATEVGIASMLLSWFRTECTEYFENTFFWDISLTFKCSKLTIETL